MTLRSRVAAAEGETPEEINELGRRTVLDLDDSQDAEQSDFIPGSNVSVLDKAQDATHRRLLDMARDADKLIEDADNKLKEAGKRIKSLVKEGYNPIVFCRYIPTAEYVAEYLHKKLPGVALRAVTGNLPSEERERNVTELGRAEKRVLVCTDCLSEGINLQEHFDAVIHYDLSWNPTRHEQREGRIDRFGQKAKKVRVLTLYGTDNQIDGIVLDVLLRKHKSIRSSLGISVPIPADTNQVVEAIFEGLLLRENQASTSEQRQLLLPGLDEYLKPNREALHSEWENATRREKRSRTMFAQESIKVEEVAAELQAARQAVGSGIDLQCFIRDALQDLGASVFSPEDNLLNADLQTIPEEHLPVRDVLPGNDTLKLGFELPVAHGVEYIQRTHPLVETLASYVMDTALDPKLKGVASRAGVIRSREVTIRTTALLVRFRYHIITVRGKMQYPLLTEDCQVFAFSGSPTDPEWLDPDAVERLLAMRPTGNIQPDIARHHLQRVIEKNQDIKARLVELATQRADELLSAHRRVRTASQQKGLRYRVEPNLPPDLLGIYVYLPDQS